MGRTKSAVMDTIEVSEAVFAKWKDPPFQRELRVNAKVRAIVSVIAQDGVIPGVISLGIIGGSTYLIDGMHRKHAFLLSGLKTAYADVRTHTFETMPEMAREFVNLQLQLVRMRPDDILRGMEGATPALARIRTRCPFVGYGHVRHGDQRKNFPIVSMSTLLRAWLAARGETPAYKGTQSALAAAEAITLTDADQLSDFCSLANQSWGQDPEYYRLWTALNVTLCMWFFRSVVLQPYGPRRLAMTRSQFAKCLMALSADSSYIDWLGGRHLSERDRSPAYGRLKAIFTARIAEDTGAKPMLPVPVWTAPSASSRAPRSHRAEVAK